MCGRAEPMGRAVWGPGRRSRGQGARAESPPSGGTCSARSTCSWSNAASAGGPAAIVSPGLAKLIEADGKLTDWLCDLTAACPRLPAGKHLGPVRSWISGRPGGCFRARAPAARRRSCALISSSWRHYRIARSERRFPLSRASLRYANYSRAALTIPTLPMHVVALCLKIEPHTASLGQCLFRLFIGAKQAQ
jgi:hypothetical protein